MTCRTIIAGGLPAIVCGPKPRAKRCGDCGRPARLLCDWKVGDGKTCDEPICASCAKEVAPDKHLCQGHQASYAAWLESRATS